MVEVEVEYFNSYGYFIGSATYVLPGDHVDGIAAYLLQYDKTVVCGQRPSYAYVNTGTGDPRIVIFQGGIS